MSKLQDVKMKTGSDFTIVLRSEFEKHISKYAGNTVIEVSNELMEHVISQLEQAQQENKRLIEALETIKTYTRSTLHSEGNKILLIEEVATQSLIEVITCNNFTY